LSRNEPAQTGPLAGVRVLDMTTVQMGPLATVILADMGADVIKVESPDGDISRQSYPSRSIGMGHSFMTLNRNKRSVALDVKQPEGRAALLKLAERTDVFVYNVRPQAMARLKLGYEDLKKVNEQIVYVAALGFSQRGRYGGRPAYDTVIQGMAGIPWIPLAPRVTSRVTRPIRRPTRVPVCISRSASLRRSITARRPGAASASTCRCSRTSCTCC